MQKTDLPWLVLLAGPLTFEAFAIRRQRRHPEHRDCTFSNLVRRWFHTDTTTGRIVFITTWAMFAAWVARHITAEV